MKYFEGFMALVYLTIGIAILWKSDELFNMPSSYSLPLGIVMTAYGVYRGYRVYQKYF
jgi:hypothetical protein